MNANAQTDEVIVEVSGSLGRIRLNRPKALNSLTLDMVRMIAAALDRFEADPAIAAVLVTGEGERGLCAGGDIRALYESGKAGTDLAETFWREEYALNARISHYSKPYVAVAAGITMGGGIGVSAHGLHRIVTETSRFAMPETGIGYFPDVGATWLLSRCSGEFGTWLGLTGEGVGAADAIHAGLADRYMNTAQIPDLIATLSDLNLTSSNIGVSRAIDRLASSPPHSPLAAHYAIIDRLFAQDRIEDILAALDKQGSDFTRATHETLLSRSPTSLVLTLRLLRLGRQSPSLEACLGRELVASLQMLSSMDFYEGIRAAIIDKDRNPRWSPDKLSAIDGIDKYLSPGQVAGLLKKEENRMADTIAFIGLGNMGGPMAANLVKAGYRVQGFDLSEASRASAGADGVTIAGSAADALTGASMVVTMLPAGRHVVAVHTELAANLKPGTLVIDCSTIDVDSARKAHQLARAAGCPSLDAPVSGGTTGAAAGTLTFMVGGQKETFDRGEPVLSHMGKRIVHCGEAGAGQAAKICNNMILGITMAGVCEAFVLAETLGLSHQALFDVASTSSGQCWSINTYCPVPGPVPTSPANNGYKPGFAASLMLKDLLLASECAKANGAATPLGSHAADIYAAFADEGHGGEDFSAVIRSIREKSQLRVSAK